MIRTREYALGRCGSGGGSPIVVARSQLKQERTQGRNTRCAIIRVVGVSRLARARRAFFQQRWISDTWRPRCAVLGHAPLPRRQGHCRAEDASGLQPPVHASFSGNAPWCLIMHYATTANIRSPPPFLDHRAIAISRHRRRPSTLIAPDPADRLYARSATSKLDDGESGRPCNGPAVPRPQALQIFD